MTSLSDVSVAAFVFEYICYKYAIIFVQRLFSTLGGLTGGERVAYSAPRSHNYFINFKIKLKHTILLLLHNSVEQITLFFAEEI